MRSGEAVRGRTARRWLARGCAALAVVAATTGPVPAAAQIDGLEVDGTTTYRIQPSAGTIQVTVTAHLVNTMPSRRVGNFIETPYFDRFAIPALGPVRNVQARSSVGGALDTSVDIQGDGFSVILLDLSPNLVYGTPQTVATTFELPGQPARSRFTTRVNPAFASWLVAGTGDAGAIDIVIDLPESFELLLTNDMPPESSLRGGRRIVRLDDIGDVADAVVFASASDDSKLRVHEVSAAGADVTLKSWPGDARWQRFATRSLKRGLAVLRDLTGVDVPRQHLTVVESSRSYALGYAGSYDRLHGVVEVGDRLDRAVILHELSHVWVNDRLFEDRWVIEGLAEELANRAVAKLGGKPTPPHAVGPRAAGAVRLNQWPPGPAVDPVGARIEAFGYRASYAVVHDMTEGLGEDGLRKVIGAAAANRISYPGDSEPEAMPSRKDWRYFVDLTQEVGGGDDATAMLRRHVVTTTQETVLEQRSDARKAYAELVAAGDGWTAPLAVREEMASWRFFDAHERMDDARALLERAGAVVQGLGDLGVDVAPRLETAYEESGDLEELATLIGSYDEIATDLGAVREQWDAAHPVARVGLLGHGSDIDRAADAVRNGDLDEAEATVVELAAATRDATKRGAALIVAVVLLVVMTLMLLRVRRMRRRPDELVATSEL